MGKAVSLDEAAILFPESNYLSIVLLVSEPSLWKDFSVILPDSICSPLSGTSAP